MLPTREEFPYAIRQVSEALGSNGSTSMGSVCASTLALLNAGVPLRIRLPASPWVWSRTVDGQTVRGADRLSSGPKTPSVTWTSRWRWGPRSS